MDARPQRIRVRGDENAPIGVPANKTIHQRNKSTPALSTMVQNGGLRNAAKRTAFGDISNVRSSRDDASLAGKNIPLASQKTDKKPLVLSQPAQRPMSVSGLRGVLNNAAGTKSTDNVAKQGPADNSSSHQTANNRKLFTKRSNAVFKDPPPPVAETKPTTVKHTIARSSDGAKQESSGRPSTTARSQQQNKTNLPETLPTGVEPSKPSREPSNLDPEQCSALRSDEVSVDDTNESNAHRDSEDTEDAKENKKPIAHATTSSLREPRELRKPDMPRDSIDLAHARSDQGLAHSEPEEYWDDEDEDNDEDDGYTTARSYRSRGDNTTGGATTVLFPKYNQKVKRELALAKQIVEATRTKEDIEDEYWDTSMVAEYGDEIFEYMRELELKMLPNAHYMDNQAEIQWSMRSVLMDWLVQVHHRFSLLPETLFLCVNYIDRFLSCKIVSLGKLQLVGATAIFIAAKYEEINCPSIQEIVYMVDGGYTVDEILKAERFMLSMLQFELGWPGPMSFLRRISKADDYDLETRTLAKYFLEVTIMDERFVGSPPSFAAAGAHCLARLMLKKGNWSPAHVYYSNYTYSQLHPLITLILECCENPQKHHAAIYEKYADRRFKRASLFVEAELAKGFRIPDISKESSCYQFS
ncbi:hypothetical protein VTN77DRAFT_8262 [Rasamsonia byssochlamydoides]|uniref:uncharacterized protein n=1 Tax=Rasamsonia byssochlamydoides TaxID=89139 RepID=UPI0037438D0A